MTNKTNSIFEPLLSLIIPVFNVGEIIRETALSIVRQNCRNFEVIIIDDGSTDQSPELLKSILDENDIHVKCIKQKNNGVSAARNKGISLTRGKLVYFLDADDLIDYDTCQFIIDTFSNNNDCDMLIFRYDFRNPENEVIYSGGDNSCDTVINNSHKLISDIMKEKYCVHLASTAYKKSILLQNSLLFNEDSGYGEDLEFISKYLVHCNKTYYSNSIHFHYIQREGSISNCVSLKRLDSLFSFLEIANYFQENNLPSEIIDYVKFIKTTQYHISHTKGLFDQLESNISSFIILKEYVNKMRVYKNANVILKRIINDSKKSNFTLSFIDNLQCNFFLNFPLSSYYCYIFIKRFRNIGSSIKQLIKRTF